MKIVRMALVASALALTWVLSFIYHLLDNAAVGRPQKTRLTGTWPVGWFW